VQVQDGNYCQGVASPSQPQSDHSSPKVVSSSSVTSLRMRMTKVRPEVVVGGNHLSLDDVEDKEHVSDAKNTKACENNAYQSDSDSSDLESNRENDRATPRPESDNEDNGCEVGVENLGAEVTADEGSCSEIVYEEAPHCVDTPQESGDQEVSNVDVEPVEEETEITSKQEPRQKKCQNAGGKKGNRSGCRSR